MRYPTLMKVEEARMQGPPDEPIGSFGIKHGSAFLRVIASNGFGWDHVSVSLPTRCPTWNEMQFIKRLFFDDSEVAFELHVAASEHVNFHATCLHLWRPQTAAEIVRVKEQYGSEWVYGEIKPPGEIPLPPAWMVGPSSQQKGVSA